MRHVVSSESYFQSLSIQESAASKLNEYFKNIPTTVFEAFNTIDFSNLGELSPKTQSNNASDLLEHQLFLIENFESVPNIIQREDFLVRAGYDTIELRLDESYLETLELLNEGVLGSVGSFIKSLVSDPDPVEMALNILRLVLDVIGIVPFTWAGFPIDIVANVLSALISLYKGEYFSMALSILAAIDVTQASDVLKFTLKPIAKIIEPALKIFCRPGAKAVAIDATVFALKDGIIRMGQGSLIDVVAKMFKSLADFMKNTMLSVMRLVAGFMDTVLNLVTFGVAKHIGKVKNLVEGIATHVNKVSGNFDTASKMLLKPAETVKATDKVISKSGKEFIAGSPQGQAIVAAQASKIKGGIEFVEDMTKVVKDDAKFMEKVAKLPPAEQAKAIAAKIENELIGNTDLAAKRIMKDPKLAKHLAEKYGWVPGKNYLEKLAMSGDVAGVKKFFEVFVSDPKISKNLSKAELRAFTPFAARPEAFVAGVKNFDDTVRMLERLGAKAGGAYAARALSLKRLLNFIARIVWQKYGSLECIVQAGANKAEELVLAGTTKLATAALSQGTQVNEEEDVTLDSNPDAKAQISANSKNDCGRVATAVQAITGAHIGNANFPGSTANLGGTMNMGDSPEQAAEFQDKSTEYSKDILTSLGLDSSIDVQHALEYNDPVAQAYFSDVYNPETGMIDVNQVDKSRMDEVIADMVKKGIITSEEAPGVKRKAQELIDSGESPNLELPPVKMDEGLFQFKSFSFSV